MWEAGGVRLRIGSRGSLGLVAIVFVAGVIASCGDASSNGTPPTSGAQPSSGLSATASGGDTQLIGAFSWTTDMDATSDLLLGLGSDLGGLARRGREATREVVWVRYGTNAGEHVTISAMPMTEPGMDAKSYVEALVGLVYGLEDVSRSADGAPVAYLMGTATLAEGPGELDPEDYVYVAAWADMQGSWIFLIESTSPELRTVALRALTA